MPEILAERTYPDFETHSHASDTIPCDAPRGTDPCPPARRSPGRSWNEPGNFLPSSGIRKHDRPQRDRAEPT